MPKAKLNIQDLFSDYFETYPKWSLHLKYINKINYVLKSGTIKDPRNTGLYESW